MPLCGHPFYTDSLLFRTVLLAGAFPNIFPNISGHQVNKLKAMVHEAIFPATCNTTDDDNIGGKVAEYLLQAVTYLTRNRVYFSWNS